MSTRNFVASALAGAIVLAQLITGQAPAQAMNQTCSPNHCYSIRYGTPTDATGVLMNTHNNNMYPGPAGSVTSATPWFVTSEMWLQDPSAGRWWIEEGIVDGYDFTYGNRQVYAHFTFSRSTTGVDSGWIYIDYTVPDGTTHYYQISRGISPNQWLVFYDNRIVYGVGLGFWSGRPVVGGECYCTNGAHADTFDIYTTLVNGAGQIVNYPGSASIHAGMNGIDYTGHSWSWNAP